MREYCGPFVRGFTKTCIVEFTMKTKNQNTKNEPLSLL